MWTSAVLAIWKAYVNYTPDPFLGESLYMTHGCCLRWSVHGRSSCMFCAATSMLSMYGIRSWVLISTLSCFTETITNWLHYLGLWNWAQSRSSRNWITFHPLRRSCELPTYKVHGKLISFCSPGVTWPILSMISIPVAFCNSVVCSWNPYRSKTCYFSSPEDTFFMLHSMATSVVVYRSYVQSCTGLYRTKDKCTDGGDLWGLSTGFTQKRGLRYMARISSYSKAILLNPASSKAYFNRGIALSMLGKDEEASQDLQR